MRIGFISQRDYFGNIIEKPAVIEEVLSMFDNAVFISGNSKGNEHLLEKACKEQGREFISINPDTTGFGFELAFIERNREILKQCDMCILVFDGTNKFGLSVIKEGIKLGKKIIVLPLI